MLRLLCLLVSRYFSQAGGSIGRPFRIVRFSETLHIPHQVMARVAVLAVLMMQALAEQTCQEESCLEEGSTLMQLKHGDLDQKTI